MPLLCLFLAQTGPPLSRASLGRHQRERPPPYQGLVHALCDAAPPPRAERCRLGPAVTAANGENKSNGVLQQRERPPSYQELVRALRDAGPPLRAEHGRVGLAVPHESGQNKSNSV